MNLLFELIFSIFQYDNIFFPIHVIVHLSEEYFYSRCAKQNSNENAKIERTFLYRIQLIMQMLKWKMKMKTAVFFKYRFLKKQNPTTFTKIRVHLQVRQLENCLGLSSSRKPLVASQEKDLCYQRLICYCLIYGSGVCPGSHGGACGTLYFLKNFDAFPTAPRG